LLPVEELCRETGKSVGYEEPESLEDCPTPVHLANAMLGEVIRLPCRRRRCEYCGRHHWKPYVQARMMNGVDDVPREEVLLLTLTAPGDASRPWNDLAPLRLNRFMTALRRVFAGARIDYWKVGEYQERGLIHYHLMTRGLRFLPHEVMRSLAVRTGFGPRVGVMHPEVNKGGMRGLLGYYGKYLVKGMLVWEERSRVVTQSRQWASTWKPREKREYPEPWRWVPDELTGLWLVQREAVRGSVDNAGIPSSALSPPLTAGPSPPFILERGG
jgi:hypothetical protein